MHESLVDILAGATRRRSVPGAALGVLNAGRPMTAFSGVTSVDNPLPMNERTLFQIGSVSKTYAATAVMRLVSEGRVALDDPVRRHLPELRLADETVAATVTVRHLLNHTSGWDGTRTSGGAEPESRLEAFVAGMDELEQLSPLGFRAEYNNAAVAVAGRLVEKLTGQPYEQAVRSQLFEPLDMDDSHFTADDLITERCAVGHLGGGGERLEVARPWRWPRAASPEGGIVSTIAD